MAEDDGDSACTKRCGADDGRATRTWPWSRKMSMREIIHGSQLKPRPAKIGRSFSGWPEQLGAEKRFKDTIYAREEHTSESGRALGCCSTKRRKGEKGCLSSQKTDGQG